MNIDLIAKNRVAEYIRQKPEAYTYLITWIKESKYNYQRLFNINSPDGTAMASMQLGASKYSIKLKLNIRLQTAYIMFLGTLEEEMAYRDKEIAEYEAKHPEEKITRVTKTYTVSKKVPAIPTKAFEERELRHYPGPLPVEGKEFVFPENINYNGDGLSVQAYEEALERVITIFNAQPDTKEFKELEQLLLLIKNYESENIKLPRFDLLEAIKLRMIDFKLLPKDLNYIVGSEEDVELFLSGKKIPTKTVLSKVYRLMGLKIPPDRDAFMIA